MLPLNRGTSFATSINVDPLKLSRNHSLFLDGTVANSANSNSNHLALDKAPVVFSSNEPLNQGEMVRFIVLMRNRKDYCVNIVLL
jgi:hypothetical protein